MPQALLPFDLLPVFNAQPGATLLLSPEWVIVAVSDDYLAAAQTQRDIIVGQFIFDAFPDNPDTPDANAVANVRASLAQVMATRQPHDMAPQHYDVPDQSRPGRFLERYWKPRHTPVLDAAGQVRFIIQSVQDITASWRAEQELRESQAREQAAQAEAETQRQRLYNVLMQLPAQVAVYHGSDHVYQFVSPNYQRMFPHRSFLGRPFREGMPEAEGLGVVALFDQVYQTGEPYYGHEMEGWFDFAGNGRPEQLFFELSLHPLYNVRGEIDGVLDFSYDVTEQVRARQQVQQLNDELEARVQQRTQELEAARAEVEEQRNRLLRLFGQAPAHINLFSGPNLVWTLVHPASQRVMPHRPFLGLPRRQALPELPDAQHALFEHVYRTGEAAYAPEESRRLDLQGNGEMHEEFFDMTVEPTYDAAGQIEGVMSFAVNVTERVRARQRAEALQAEVLAAARWKAREQQDLFQIYAQTEALVALMRGPGHRYEYVNPAYQRFFPGRSLMGHEVAEVAPEMVEQGFAALLDEVYRSGETFFGKELLFTPPPPAGQPARPAYFNFTYQAYREGGVITGVSVFAFDVTEQVEARQQREAERQQLQAVFAQAPVAVGVFRGEDYVFDIVNPLMAAMVGRPLAELIGRPFFEALPELRTQGLPAVLHDVRRTGIPFVAEEREFQLAHHRPGQPRYYNFVYQPLWADDGQVTAVVCVAIDVSEQVRARRQVQDLNEQLQTTNQQLQATNAELNGSNQQLVRTNVDLDNFIYTASHDLKAPISNIEGLLYLLQEELPAAVAQHPDVSPILTRMLDAVERFQRTIEHLTDVSKLQKENTPATTLVNLAAVVEDVRQDLQPQLQAVGAKLFTDVSALPPVQFTEKNLRSIVYNLLSNAVKYRHPARTPHIDVRAHVRPGHTVLEVHDNGLGLDEAHLPRLFTMFQRFHSHVEGTGIGLYMVKRMVENAGGRMEVHSQLGAGTTFFVFLPHSATPTGQVFPAYQPS